MHLHRSVFGDPETSVKRGAHKLFPLSPTAVDGQGNAMMQSIALSQLEESISNLEVMHENGRAEQKPQYAADLGSITEARERIAAFIHTTAVVTSSSLDALAGCNLFFKCELLQKGYEFQVS